ncbi:MAG: 1-phosphofructokinase family hexose kinase [Capsulimonadales bacterium]|nr:1-phosphofructokinase family hexose kinase [Capsulimonadales bacterium]
MICVLGLTPTVQRTLFFTNFAVGEVNRSRRTLVTASGKGANVARVLVVLGANATLVQILGGDSGRYVARMQESEGIHPMTVWHEDDAPTRTCTTILTDGGVTTELVEEAPAVGLHDVRLLLASARNALLTSRVLCCSGSLPPDVPEDFYAQVAREANRLDIPVVLDAQKGPLRAALSEHPYLVKPNLQEAAATLGMRLTGNAPEDARTALDGLRAAGARNALISLGKAGALFGDGNRTWLVAPPALEAVNPIGSGDSLCAGFIEARFVRDLPPVDALRFGTACAAANALTPTSGVVDPSVVKRLLPDVTVTSV